MLMYTSLSLRQRAAAAAFIASVVLVGCDRSPEEAQTASQPAVTDEPAAEVLTGPHDATPTGDPLAGPPDAVPVTPETAPTDGADFRVAGLSWPVPEGWEHLGSTSSMRAAEARAPGPGGQATVVFFYFGDTSGGGVEDNLARWSNQMMDENEQPTEPRIEKLTVADFPVTLAEMEGTFLDGSPMGPKTERPDYGFRGAIIQGPEGNVFIRLYGPNETINAIDATWRTMIMAMQVG